VADGVLESCGNGRVTLVRNSRRYVRAPCLHTTTDGWRLETRQGRQEKGSNTFPDSFHRPRRFFSSALQRVSEVERGPVEYHFCTHGRILERSTGISTFLHAHQTPSATRPKPTTRDLCPPRHHVPRHLTGSRRHSSYLDFR